MCFWMVWPQQGAQPKRVARLIEPVRLHVEAAQIEEQLPVAQAEFNGLLIIGQPAVPIADYPVGKPKMIIRESLARMLPNQRFVQRDRLRIVLHPEIIV